MKILYLGGKQVGCIGLLTLLAAGYQVEGIIAYDDMLKNLAKKVIPASAFEKEEVLIFKSINYWMGGTDLVVSVHGREIVPRGLLREARYGGINVHPCLFKYKGAHPVERLLADRETRASVGAHRMTDKVDEGEVLVEKFVDVEGAIYPEEVYNKLYPYYSLVLLEALEKVNGQHTEEDSRD